MKKPNIQQRKCSACHPLAMDTLPLINSFVDYTVFYVDGFMAIFYSGQQMQNFCRSQGRSQPRRCGGAPASGKWARGWVRTNVSHSAAGVLGSRPPDFFCIFLIQNPVFWYILWLRKWTLSVFFIKTYALGERKTVGRGCQMRPEEPKIEAKGRDRGGVLREGTASPTSYGVWQWCKQDQILKTKTKTKITRPRPRPPEANKGNWRI